MPARPGFLSRFFTGLWNVLDFARRLFFNIVFLVIVGVLLFAWMSGDRPPRLASDTALVLNLQGDLVEEQTLGAREAAVAELVGEQRYETRLRDVLLALDTAAKDPQISRAVLSLDQMGRAGQASLREIGAALERFKATGKPVYAWGENFSQSQYYLAAHANELYLHPAGLITVRGIAARRGYYKGLLDKVGVKVHAFQAGRFKTFAEPFTRTDQSPEAREADAYLLNDLWSTWTADVERARGLARGTVDAVIAALPQRLTAASGDIAQLALNERLVDGLYTRDEFRSSLLDAGAPRSTADEETFRQVSLFAYLRYARQPATRDAVGVVVLQGEILPGDARQGRVGARTASELIQRARQDDAVKALVVRIDSPGGAVQASELIREQLDLTRDAGKPVIVSMGDVAASGGYWIAMGGDEVYADATTITGSIGVFGLIPTFEGTLEHLGVTTDGVATTWLADAADPRRPLDKRMAQVLDQVVAGNYKQFVSLVAERRRATAETINESAQGRVWTGAQAKERGLVDTLGGLEAALQAAARRAELGTTWRVQYIEREPRGLARILALLFGGASASWIDSLQRLGLLQTLAGSAPADVRRSVEMIARARENPLAAFSYCFCDLR
jgi:protease IV